MSFSTMKKIQSVTVTGATQNTIEFTNIPGTFDDLILVASLRSNQAGATVEAVRVELNGNSSAVYSGRQITGNGAAASSTDNGSTTVFRNAGIGATSVDATASTFSSCQLYIPNYSNTTTNKSVSFDWVNENNATTAYQRMAAGLFSSTAAITSIKLQCDTTTNSFVTHSTAVLYGIKKS